MSLTPGSRATTVNRSVRLEYENETIAELLERLSHNSASGKPKSWAPRLKELDCKVITFACEVCRDPAVDEHEAMLQKAALDSLGRSRAAFFRLMKCRRDQHVKSGGDGAQWIDSLVGMLGDLHEKLRGVIVPQARESRQAQILAQIELSVSLANAADLGVPPIPREALRALLEWGREQA